MAKESHQNALNFFILQPCDYEYNALISCPINNFLRKINIGTFLEKEIETVVLHTGALLARI